ncbi:MAG: ABC transporter ATP-binding protein, partial [Actinobacteria bacterium]|nr:ABC transporter ATP-binding protein [Actinomycetota bacterium]
MAAPQPADRARSDGDPLLSVRRVTKHFPVRGGVLLRTIGHIHAVDDVSFDINAGETFGLVGESGCGKTTIGRVILRIHPPTSGTVLFEGADITAMDRKRLARHMQVIFQDPFGSLDPRLTVGGIIREGLEIQRIGTAQERAERVRETMEVVGVSSHYAQRYPHEFSGGQRQRIGIARALVLQPAFIVCDEPVSALDVSIQSQILNLLRDL